MRAGRAHCPTVWSIALECTEPPYHRGPCRYRSTSPVFERTLADPVIRDVGGSPLFIGPDPGDGSPVTPEWLWLGAGAGFQIFADVPVPTPADQVLLSHRCGWERPLINGVYLGNTLVDQLAEHRQEGCQQWRR